MARVIDCMRRPGDRTGFRRPDHVILQRQGHENASRQAVQRTGGSLFCRHGFQQGGLAGHSAGRTAFSRVMTKSGIRILEETPGQGPELKKGDRVRLRYDIQLSRGEFVARDRDEVWTVGDRGAVAGFRYGLEGMRAGGTRRFRASPHLLYGDEGFAGIPKRAVLIFEIKSVEILA